MTDKSAKAAKKPAAGKAGNPLRHLRTSDLRGIAKLATHSTTGIHKITEGVHQAVLSTLGMPRGKTKGETRGLTGLVYKSIHGVTGLVAKSIDTALSALQPLFDLVEEQKPGTYEREAVLAALNGVMGDRLAETNNPLATTMSFWCHGEQVKSRSPIANTTGKVAVIIHGLGINEMFWRVVKYDENGVQTSVVELGESLATELGYTPIYLRYNTGLHISKNGRELAVQLEKLLAYWPVPVEELTLVGYSMGGLVSRSACHYGATENMRWPGYLRNVVFLASPHHGSPLEKAGNLLDVLLGVNPYSAPYGKLLKLRSAGITDLRFGHVRDEDWQGHDRFRRKPDSRLPVPLPVGPRCFALAATIAAKRSKLSDRLTGDGLVPLHSALGMHDDPAHALKFGKDKQAIFHQMNHMEVPGRPEVVQQVVEWLRPGVKTSDCESDRLVAALAQ